MTDFLGDFHVRSYMRSSNTLSIRRCSAVIFLKLPLKIQVMQRFHLDSGCAFLRSDFLLTELDAFCILHLVFRSSSYYENREFN